MAQPVNVPRWNTDGSNRTDPPSGQKDTGQVAGSPLDSSYYNWIHFTIYQWVLYLKNLTSEALTWLALQTFTKGIAVTTDVSDSVAGEFTEGPNTGGSYYAIKANGRSLINNIGYTGGEGLTILSDATGLFVNATDGNLFFANSPDYPAISIQQNGGAPGLTVFGAEGAATFTAAGDFDSLYTYVEGSGFALVAENVGTGPAAKFIGGVGAWAAEFHGTSGGGLVAYGDTGSNAISGVGDAAYGVDSYSANHAALRAVRGDSNSLSVFDCRGAIDFDLSTAPSGALPVKNKLGRKSFPKASIQFVCNNTVSPSINDRQNVFTITQHATNGTLTLTFSQPMANTNYLVQAWSENEPIYSAVEISTKTINGFVMRPKGTNDNAYKITSTLDVIIFNVIVWGDQ